MAFTERYVTTAAAGGGNGLAEGTAWTLDEAAANVADGMRINTKAGTYNRTAVLAINLAGKVRWEAYTTTAGDGVGEATIDGGAVGASFILMNWGPSSTANEVIGFVFGNNGASGTAAQVSTLSTGAVMFRRCRFRGTPKAGPQLTNAVECEFSCVSSEKLRVSTNIPLSLTRCEFSGAGRGVASEGNGMVNVRDCIFRTTGIAIDVNSSSSLLNVTRSDFRGNTDAIKYLGGNAINVESCNFISNTGYAVNTTTLGIIRNCGFGSGTKANTSGIVPVGSNTEVAGSVTYTLDTEPWVDAANGDFRLALAAAKGAGRGTFVQATGATVGYPDIGAAQHQEAVTPTDYPAVGKVFLGTPYNFGALVGTRADAATADVRSGTTYGDPAAPLTGLLLVPTAASGGLTGDVRAIVRGLLDVTTVTYEPRLAGDAYGPAVTWQARKQPLTSGDDGSGKARRWCRWQLYQTAGQTVLPARRGRITDAAGVKYEVATADRRFAGQIFTCDCVQDLPITNP